MTTVTHGKERLRAELGKSFQARCFDTAGVGDATRQKVSPDLKPDGEWRNFNHLTGDSLCRACLLADGYEREQVNRLSNADAAKAAFGFPAATPLRNASPAGHVTGTLADITMDAINKTLLAGYEEAPQTWRGPMRQAASVPDFKDIHRIRLGAVPNLPAWPDNTVPEEAKLNDEKVSYAVEARAEKVSFSWRLFVNDDMDALARIPKLLGDAAARTINKVAWAQVTGNPVMSYDSVNLFSAASGARKRANLITGSATPTTATVGAMAKLMRLMRGANTADGNESDDILNLTPRYIVGPAALAQTLEQLVFSSADPAANYSSAVYNTARNLVPVIEPLLDVDSSTAWYLFADPNRIDTVEVTFLQGQEQPQTHDWVDPETLSRHMSVVQTFAAKAIDHRGVVKHAGA